MSFKAQQLADLSKILADHVALGFLLDLRHDEVSLAIDSWRKEFAGDPDGGRLKVAEKIVDAYASQGLVPQLAHSLFRRLNRDDIAAAKLVAYCRDPDEIAGKHVQASLAQRANTLKSTSLRRFLADCEPRICVVLAEGPAETCLGTGFLVGPDLLLTSYHTLQEHISAGKQLDEKRRSLVALFDHLDGPAISVPLPKGKLREVRFADQWLEAESEWMKGDGTYDNPTPTQIKALKSKLDFVLVRLAEPVGLESYAGNGGRRRSWFSFDPSTPDFRLDRRVIIPQHPSGMPQQVDFGRYKESCKSGTRIRYDTESFKGTSGAPCFDESFYLIGMHNAEFAPKGVPLFNQAIRFDRLVDKLGNLLTPPVEGEKQSRLWSVTSGVDAPRPILGRGKLIDWIGRATTEQASVGDRLFAAVGKMPNSGRYFSIEILRAALLDSGDPVVELGTKRVPMLSSAADLIRTIIDQLAIPHEVMDGMPPRPSSDAPDASDKLNKWASEEVPVWFDGVLRTHRTKEIDARELAKLQLQIDEMQGKKSRQEDVDMAERPEKVPLLQTRWDRLWIALRFAEQGPETEVSNLLAGLAGAGDNRASLGTELTRIRWLFLGCLPDFLAALLSEPEHLDPSSIDPTAFLEAAEAIAESVGRPYPQAARGILLGWAKAIVDGEPDPSARLQYLQGMLARLTPSILADARQA